MPSFLLSPCKDSSDAPPCLIYKWVAQLRITDSRPAPRFLISLLLSTLPREKLLINVWVSDVQQQQVKHTCQGTFVREQ